MGLGKLTNIGRDGYCESCGEQLSDWERYYCDRCEEEDEEVSDAD